MKYFTLIALAASMSVFAQTNSAQTSPALEDHFAIKQNNIEKPVNSQYEEKTVSDGKVFHMETETAYSITKGKKNSMDNLDVYQLKMEQINGKLEKFEQVVEMDKEEAGKVKSVFKCGMGGKKGGCQAYSIGFCEKLLKEDKIDEKLSKDGEAKTLEFYKKLYKEKDAFEPKNIEIAKLREFNEKAVLDVGKTPNKKELKDNLKPVYPSPLVLFKKEKIKDDIAECRKLGGIWVKPKANSQPNNVASQGSANAQ